MVASFLFWNKAKLKQVFNCPFASHAKILRPVQNLSLKQTCFFRGKLFNCSPKSTQYSAMSKVSDKVRVTRNKKNISQEYMASVIGIDTSSYHRLEKGNSPITLDRLEKIAEVLGVSMHALVCGEDHSNHDPSFGNEYLHHLKQEVAFLRKQLQEKEAQLSILLESKLDPHRSAANPLR